MKDQMNFSELSNYQLYEIIQNSNLDKDTRNAANIEFNNRNLSIDKIKQIIAFHDSQFKPDVKGLETWHKLTLILFPFLIPIHSIIAGKLLAKVQKKSWKEYWFFLSMGYLFWTILIILFFRYFMVNTS